MIAGVIGLLFGETVWYVCRFHAGLSFDSLPLDLLDVLCPSLEHKGRPIGLLENSTLVLVSDKVAYSGMTPKPAVISGRVQGIEFCLGSVSFPSISEVIVVCVVALAEHYFLVHLAQER